MLDANSAGRQSRIAQRKAFIHLIQNARFLPGHIPKITSLLWRKSRGKPVPFFFRLLHPEYRVEDLAIAATRAPAPGRGRGKKILNARPIGVGEGDLKHRPP